MTAPRMTLKCKQGLCNALLVYLTFGFGKGPTEMLRHCTFIGRAFR